MAPTPTGPRAQSPFGLGDPAGQRSRRARYPLPPPPPLLGLDLPVDNWGCPRGWPWRRVAHTFWWGPENWGRGVEEGRRGSFCRAARWPTRVEGDLGPGIGVWGLSSGWEGAGLAPSGLREPQGGWAACRPGMRWRKETRDGLSPSSLPPSTPDARARSARGSSLDRWARELLGARCRRVGWAGVVRRHAQSSFDLAEGSREGRAHVTPARRRVAGVGGGGGEKGLGWGG